MRKIMLIDPFRHEDAVIFAVIADFKARKIKYVAVRKRNAGYFVYDERGNMLFGEEYRPYFRRMMAKIAHTTTFIENLREAFKMLEEKQND